MRRPKQTDFELGIRQVVEGQQEAKVPRRKSTPMLFAYIAIFGIFLPGLFMGLGNFLICPFSIPNGWKMPSEEARGHCDQLGAQKAAIIYTTTNIFYGIFIGYASKHLIHRGCSYIRVYLAKRKRIYEQGRKSEVNRIAKDKVTEEKNKVKAKLKDTERKLAEIAQQEKNLGDLEDAIDGSKSRSYRKGRRSRSRDRPREDFDGFPGGPMPKPGRQPGWMPSVPPMPYTPPQRFGPPGPGGPPFRHSPDPYF